MKLRHILFSKEKIYNRLKTQILANNEYSHSEEYIKNLPVFDYARSNDDRNRVYSWGSVKTGALGVKYSKQKNLISSIRHPKRLGFGEKYNVISTATGFGFTAFVVENSIDGKVYGTGLNTDSQIGCHQLGKRTLEVIYFPQPVSVPFCNVDKVKVKKVSAGRAHLAVLTDEGLFLLGNNAYGQCGRQIIENESFINNQTVNHIVNIFDKQITDVVCGQDHTIAVTTDGAVYSCGWGADGQTGLGHYNSTPTFTKVKGDIENERIVKLSCRSDFVLALNDRGQVFGWGNTEYGQISTDDDLQQVSNPLFLKSCQDLGKIIDVASGGSFCMVLNEERHVYVWGFGLLGAGPRVQESIIPIHISPTLFGLNDFSPNNYVKAVECGLSHLAAVTTDGDLFIWGRNRDCCLGLGTTNDQFFPLKVAIGGKVKQVSLGFDHTVAICEAFTAD